MGSEQWRFPITFMVGATEMMRLEATGNIIVRGNLIATDRDAAEAFLAWVRSTCMERGTDYVPFEALKQERARAKALVDALEAALPIIECEEARHDILLKCTQVEGATDEEKRLREKHLRGKRREAYRARKAIEAALAAYDDLKREMEAT